MPIQALKKLPLSSYPLSIVLAIVLVVAYIVPYFLGHRPAEIYGVSLPYNPADLRSLSAGITTANLPALILMLLFMPVLAFRAEGTLGTKRFGCAIFLSQVIAVPTGLVIARGVEETGLNWWGAELLGGSLLTPMPWMAGSLATASALMTILWRRRIRIILLTLSLTMVLYAGSVAAVVSLVAIIGGIGLGKWFARRDGIKNHLPEVGGATLRETRTLIATVVAVVALGPVLTGLNPAATGPLSSAARLMWPPDIAYEQVEFFCGRDGASGKCVEAVAILTHQGLGATLANILPLIAQLVIAQGLKRGRRAAWWLAIIAQLGAVAAIITQIIVVGNWPADAVLAAINLIFLAMPWLVVCGILLAYKRFFTVKIAARVWWRNTMPLPLWAAIPLFTWIFGARFLATDFSPTATWAHIISDIPARFGPPVLAGILPGTMLPQGALAWALAQWCGVVFWFGLCWQLWKLLTANPKPARDEERRKARRILKNGTGDHLAAMTLWSGNRYWFNAGNDAYVAYRLAHGVAVTVGGPVLACHLEKASRGEIATEFEKFAAAKGWPVAWYSVNDDFAALLRNRGWQQVHIAEEAILHAKSASFKGKKYQNIRTAINRAAKEEITAVWTTWRNAGTVMQEKMVALSEEWANEKGLPEMGFTLGSIEEIQDPDTQLLLAVGADSHLHGMTSWLPIYENGQRVGLILDVMRRDSKGFRPAIEFLLAQGLLGAVEQGLQWVSLSGAPLAPPSGEAETGAGAAEHAAEHAGAVARSIERQEKLVGTALDYLGQRMEPLYGFRSLAASKYKFHPEHRSWYLCYSDELGLPAIGLAVAQCYLPTMRPRDLVEAVRLLRSRRDV